MVQMNLFAKQKWSHRYPRQTYGTPGREEWDELGDMD